MTKPKASAMKEADINAELIEAGHDAEFIERMKWGNKIKMLDTLRAEEILDAQLAEGHVPDSRTDEPDYPEFAPLLIPIEGTKDYIFNGHMGTGPSAAERWMHCTASLGAARAFLETLTGNQQQEFAVASVAARQGTTAHAAAEVEARLILGEMDDAEVANTLMELAINPDADEAYDEEMAEYITEYTDLIQTYVDEGRTVLIEQRVSAVVPLMTVDADGDPELYELTGSLDCGVLPSVENNVLTVDDLKYGNGVYVDVEHNPQIRIYGLGLLAMLADDEGNLPEIDSIEYHIIQPRLGGIKTWSESVDDLLDWRDEVLSPALTEALGGLRAGAKFSPSESACQWCPARGGCPALAEQRTIDAQELFGAISDAEFAAGPGALLDSESLSDERLGTLLSQALGLDKIVADLKAEAQRRLHRGEQVPGFKLVSYTPPRRWDSSAQGALAQGEVEGLTKKERDSLFKDPTLITPTQAIKVLGDKADKIEALIDAPNKRPVIAPEHDARKDWTGTPPEQMFDIIEEES